MSEYEFTVIEEVQEVVVETVEFPITVMEGSPGEPGPPGPSGEPGNSGTVVAGEDIPGHRVIVISSNLAFVADPTNSAHGLLPIGVVRDATLSGQTCTYYTGGDLNGGSFSVDTNYFVGLGGQLSTTYLALGATWIKRIGVAKTTSILIIDMDPTILL